MPPRFNFNLLDPFQTPFDPLTQPGGGTPQAPPGDMGAILSTLLPYLREVTAAQTAGRAELPRQVQALRGGGRREPITGALQATSPAQAQQEHEQLWANMFTPTSGRIAKERERFQTPAGTPTFTEQELMNPQQRIASAMGGGWENLTPAERRTRLQQRTGQVPDFANPMAVQAPPQAPTPATPQVAPPAAAKSAVATPSKPSSRTYVPPAPPTENRPAYLGAQHPGEEVPVDFGAAQAEARAGAGDIRPYFEIIPPSTPMMSYRGQQIPAVPEGGVNMNKLILDEAERVRQLGLQRRAAQEPFWSRIAQTIAPMTDITGGYQPGAGFPRQPGFAPQVNPPEPPRPWLYGGLGELFHR